MSEGPFGVLFLCTGNSARSILAEALLEKLGAPQYRAYSAGSQPKTEPHPLALETLTGHGFEVEGFRSKSWSEFAEPGAPAIEIVLTVCGNAAAETCPVWPGAPLSAHWGVEDPAALEGPLAAQRALFEAIYAELRGKVEALVALDPAATDRAVLAERLRSIGAGDA